MGRFTFAAHITSSLGWVGAVMVFLVLALIALTSQDGTTVRGAYLVMAPAAWFVLVPLARSRVTAERNRLIPRDTVGPVPALLGCHEATDNRLRDGHPLDLYGDVP